MEQRLSLLSRSAILENLGRGIIIEPFREEQLRNCSYDVRLGEYYFRRRTAPASGDFFFNPYDDEMVRRHYEGPIEAQLGGNWKNIEPTDRVIIMQPSEMILGHTEEFIGGTKDPETGRCFTAEMKARTSAGRVGFEVCRCAGWGDVGYVNRWTMEIVCTSPVPIVLVVGTRLAQFKFYEVAPVDDCYLYGRDPNRDHYQNGTNIEEIKKKWHPEMMLLRLTTD
jgi:dCTP deaminase